MAASDRRLGVILIAPTLLLILGLVLYPFLHNFWMSFQNLSAMRATGAFVGLANYVRIFGQRLYWKATIKTIFWTVAVVGGQVVLGLGIALLLNEPFRGQQLFRSFIMLPYTISTVVVAWIFKWMLNDLFGIVNHLLQAIGLIREPIIWLGRTNTAMATVIVAAIWCAVPLVVLMLLAGLQAIPQELYDAAKVDGANYLQELWFVTLPGLSRVLQTVVILKTIWTFNWFDLIYLLTGGGPGEGTTILPVLVYREGFKLLRFSRSSAISVTMFIYLLGLMFLQFRVIGSSEE